MHPSFRIYSDTCVLGEDAAALRVGPALVEVEEGRIATVSEGRDGRARATVVLERKLLSPSFVNAHTHLSLHALRGVANARAAAGNLVEEVFFRLEEHVRPEDVRAFARVGAIECALNGVGVVFDHYYHAEALAAGIRDVGLAAVVAPTLQDLAGPGRTHSDAALQSTRDLATAPWRDAGIVPAVGPHATDTVSAVLWARALDVAEELGVPLHAHVAQSEDEWKRISEREGCGPITWLAREGLLDRDVPQLLVHALYVDREELRRLQRGRHRLGACPFSQMQFGFPAPVHAWDEIGVDWVVGTDCVASNDSMNVQKELRLLAGQRSYAVTHGPDVQAMLEGATPVRVDAVAKQRHAHAEANVDAADPARLLACVWNVPGDWHPGLRTGAIAAGRRADLAVWDLDHPALWPTEGAGASPLRSLAFGDTSSALHSLCVGGRWIGAFGDVRALLRDLDARTIHAEAQARRAELFARAGMPL